MDFLEKTNIENHTNSYNNAGGYGFWCNKECAERKDAKNAAKLGEKQSGQQFQDQLLGFLQSGSGSQKSPTGMYIIAGLGILAILGVAYFAFRQKRGGSNG